MPPKERQNQTPPGRYPTPPNQALSWQQQQNAETFGAPASFSPQMAAALEECEMKFVMNLPESELQSPERLFFQMEQVRARSLLLCILPFLCIAFCAAAYLWCNPSLLGGLFQRRSSAD